MKMVFLNCSPYFSRCIFAQKPPSVVKQTLGSILYLESTGMEDESAIKNILSLCFCKKSIVFVKEGPDAMIQTGFSILKAGIIFFAYFMFRNVFVFHFFVKNKRVPKTSREVLKKIRKISKVFWHSSGKSLSLVGQIITSVKRLP